MKKIKPIRSEAYKQYISEQPCDACGQPPIPEYFKSFLAHITMRNKFSVKGTGQKEHDIHGLAICPRCFYLEQNRGRGFWTARVDIEERILYHWERFIDQYPVARPFVGMDIIGLSVEDVMEEITSNYQ